MILWLLALGCSSEPIEVVEPIFVRDGIIVSSTNGEGRPVGENRRLVETAWNPGETVSLGSTKATAPLRPECIPLFHVPLSDVSSLTISGGVAPNSTVAFSPDGSLLAVGSHQGDLVVVDGWTGAEIARTTLPEALVKKVAWSPDGRILYAGEQSPDATVHAFEPTTLESKWTFRAADHVGSSPLPEGEDRYAIYDLPGIYTLKVLGNGDVLAVAVHGWNDASDTRRNQSQVFRFSPTGEVVSQWPQQAKSTLLLHSVVSPWDDGTERLLMNTGRSADGPPPADLPDGGLAVLSLDTMTLQSVATVEPLQPWFKSTHLWHAMDLNPTHGMALGLGDGRLIFKNGAEPHDTRAVVQTGTPIMAGEVPIAASVGFGRFVNETFMYTTSDTNIPWGAAVPELRPPSLHPGANGLWVTDTAGKPLWSWQGDMRIQGLSASPNQRLGIIGGGHRSNSEAPTTHGAIVFDLSEPTDGRSGADRRLSTCATANPVYFEHQVLDDGRIAVVEFPIPDGSGGIKGSYRATVLR